jgi:hypothetical protein
MSAQLTITNATLDELTSADVTTTYADVTDGTVAGQLVLFVEPETPAARKIQGLAASNIGEAGEALFAGCCRAYDLPLLQAGRGQIGPDFHVNGWRIQVKASANIRRDGRMEFRAGSGKRFADYAGLIDFFAFVYVGTDDHYGLTRILGTDAVFRRWKGSSVYLIASEMRRTPDLSMLDPARQ